MKKLTILCGCQAAGINRPHLAKPVVGVRLFCKTLAIRLFSMRQ